MSEEMQNGGAASENETPKEAQEAKKPSTSQERINAWKERNAGHQMNGGHMEGRGSAMSGTYIPSSKVKGPLEGEELPEDEYFAATKPEGVATVGTVFGFLGALACGLTFIGTLAVGAAVRLGGVLGLVGFGAAAGTAACAAVGFLSVRKAKRMQHFRTYRTMLEETGCAELSEMAAATGQSEDKVRRELKKLMKEGMIKQGHFDYTGKKFISSDEKYEIYRATEANAARQKLKQEIEEAGEAALPLEVKKVLAQGEEYKQQIRSANSSITDENVNSKLYRMDSIVTRIFEELKKKPGQVKKLSMFMDYYLPTTTKLVTKYEELDKRKSGGENIKEAKKEIEGSLDVINDAYEKLLDSFFADTALDVSTDISVLKTLMKQEGLAEDDIKAMQKKAEQIKEIEQGPTIPEMQAELEKEKKEVDPYAADPYAAEGEGGIKLTFGGGNFE